MVILWVRSYPHGEAWSRIQFDPDADPEGVVAPDEEHAGVHLTSSRGRLDIYSYTWTIPQPDPTEVCGAYLLPFADGSEQPKARRMIQGVYHARFKWRAPTPPA